MDNLRIFLWVGLLMLVWLNVQTWQQTFSPPTATTTATPANGASPAGQASQSPDASAADSGALPALQAGTTEAAPTVVPPAADTDATTAASALIHVRTDVFDLQIDTRGGNIVDVRLPTYPVHKDKPDVPVELLNQTPVHFFVYQDGLRAANGQPEANHLATFTAATDSFEMAPGADELQVPLRWQDADGITVTKTYTFHRGSFAIDQVYTVTNHGDKPYEAAQYLQIQRVSTPQKRSMFDVDTYSFHGPVAYNGEKYQKIKVEDLHDTPFSENVSNGWFAAIQHHFLAAAVPPPDQVWHYNARLSDGKFQISAIGPLTTVAPGQTENFSAKLFVGPKLQKQLSVTAPRLELTVDYGRLTLLAQPMFWLLSKVHGVVHNWGLAIILVTFLIKLVFYKLAETSGRSMAGMRKLQPRMKALQERFKDDRQAMSKALMELYKKEKINPAAGCLPMLVQIPFFISFYWVLLESVEMRQAPFILWITDLSSKDPYFILPLLMGAAMFFQQKLNPPPPDPVQAKMMQIMPIAFTVFFAFFPAGLVLYWLTNSVLSIAQQWRINKMLGAN
ncbi:MAG: membrane protein insertase YidC [Gammaproteobacteria bacterium]